MWASVPNVKPQAVPVMNIQPSPVLDKVTAVVTLGQESALLEFFILSPVRSRLDLYLHCNAA